MENTSFILLRQIELFKSLSDEDLRKVLELAFIKDYQPGMSLFYEGMDGDVMYVIINGEVQLFKKNEQNETIPIVTLHDGAFFGEMSLIESEKRSATAKITNPTKMLVITRRAFQRMLDVDPRITSQLLMIFLKVLSSRLRLATGIK